MEKIEPLHISHVNEPAIRIQKAHTLLHCAAVSFLVYYRAVSLTRDNPALPWLIVLFAAELILFAIWFLDRAFRWRPVSRTVFVDRLPDDEKLPAIEVFVFTADPEKEPTLQVVNTVISAMAMDYPPEKLNVYLSDDGGSEATRNGMREACRFARHWIPFCRRFRISKRCPEAYFSDDVDRSSDQSVAEREMIYEKYQKMKESLRRFRETFEDKSGFSRVDHPSVVEVIQSNTKEEEEEEGGMLPRLVYVSREKRPSQRHHFKAGAINTLLRVSGVMSNAPFVLALDCDMYCNDSTSAKQAMCFHLDPEMSPSLAFVQFPHRFHNVALNDIYDTQLRSAYRLLWQGLDGLDGPVLSGTGFVIKRLSLYGSYVQRGVVDPLELKKVFGPSIEFIRSVFHSDSKKPNNIDSQSAMLEEAMFLASCTYGSQTKWGHEVGFLQDSVAEDYLTGFALQSKGWRSVFLSSPEAQFLGSGVTSLNDLLTQGTRWSSGLVEVGISKFCPFTYSPSKMSFLERMCYANLSFFPLYFLPIWCFAIIPQLCLLKDISLYPKVSSSFFTVFLFIFASSLAHHFYEVLTTGGSFRSVINEQRLWMIKSVTSHMYGSLDAFMKRIGAREASFSLTNKAEDNERVELYDKGLFDFRLPSMFLAPIALIVTLNVASFLVGIVRAFLVGGLDEMFVQVFISFYVLVVSYPFIEGMVIRKDKGRVPRSITVLSAILITMIAGSLFSLDGSTFLMY